MANIFTWEFTPVLVAAITAIVMAVCAVTRIPAWVKLLITAVTDVAGGVMCILYRGEYALLWAWVESILIFISVMVLL